MPRWLTGLLVLVILLAWVLPNPTRAGNTTGNAINSMVAFVRSAGDSLMTMGGSGAGTSAPGRVGTYPYGGVESGDGSLAGSLAGTSLPEIVSTDPPAVPAPNAGPTLSHSPPVQLHIPSIGVTSGFVPLGLGFDGSLSVPTSSNVAGWYTDAPTPGEKGPAVVTAHVDWKHQLGVFHDLGRLKPGNDVTVDRADGHAVTYRVTRVASYLKSHFPTRDVYGGTDDAELRMITCGGPYDSFTRSYDNNIVVFASMVGHT